MYWLSLCPKVVYSQMGGLVLYVHIFPLLLQISSLASSPPKIAIVSLTQIAFNSEFHVYFFLAPSG